MSQGTLYLIATPIGNLADISTRALQVLAQVDVIAAEDTRHSKILLAHYQVGTPMVSMHGHNEAQQAKGLLSRLQSGESVAVISDAGTPLISDPGFSLVRAARDAGVTVVPIPGPCALIAALSASGLPADRFVFEGFLPAKSAARRARLQDLRSELGTLIFYESPRRVLALLQDLCELFGEGRQVVIARELTKQFETIHGGALNDVIAWMQADENQRKGEFVVLVHGAKAAAFDVQRAQEVLSLLLPHMGVKQAANICAQITGYKKNALYDLALTLPSDAAEQ